MGWKHVTDQIKNGERSGDRDLAPLTNLDAVFGRGRKVDGIRKGSLYRNLIEIHVTPYNNISVSNANVRIDYIQDKIMSVLQDMGGRFVMRQVGGTSGFGERKSNKSSEAVNNNGGLIELFPEQKDDRSLILKKIRRALFNENKRRLELSDAKREAVEEEMEDRLLELNAQLIEKRKGGQHLARAQAQAEARALQAEAEAEDVPTPPRKTKTAAAPTMTTRKVKKVLSTSSRDTQSNADTDTTASESVNSSSSSHNSQQLMDDYIIDDAIDADGGFLSEIDDLILHNDGQGAASDPLVSWDFQFDDHDASFDSMLQQELA